MAVANYQDTGWSYGDLKLLCERLKVPRQTRAVAYGLHKTNPQAAQKYVEGYQQRNTSRRRKYR